MIFHPLGRATKTVSMNIFYNNCHGFNSKKESIEKDVVEKLWPSVVNLYETLLRNSKRPLIMNMYCSAKIEQMVLEGMELWPCFQTTSLTRLDKAHVTKVSSNNKYDEYMVTRLDNVKPAAHFQDCWPIFEIFWTVLFACDCFNCF